MRMRKRCIVLFWTENRSKITKFRLFYTECCSYILKARKDFALKPLSTTLCLTHEWVCLKNTKKKLRELVKNKVGDDRFDKN